jgi:hypothetical protein
MLPHQGYQDLGISPDDFLEDGLTHRHFTTFLGHNQGVRRKRIMTECFAFGK